MKRLVFALLALAVACAAPFSAHRQELRSDPVGLWVRLESGWAAAPVELGYEEYTVRARFLRIHADGQLSILHCLLRRNRTGTGLSPGDGYVLFRGAWRVEHGEFVAQYVKAEETIPSSDPPFVAFVQAPIRVKDHTVALGEEDFKEGTLVSLADYDAFVKPVASVTAASHK